MGEPTFKALRAIEASLNQRNVQQNAMHEQRLKEFEVMKAESDKSMETMRSQLYVEVEQFRMAHHTEIRRGIEVAMDLAVRSLPWWKRWGIRKKAEEILVDIREMISLEAERINKEVAVSAKKEEVTAVKENVQENTQEMGDYGPVTDKQNSNREPLVSDMVVEANVEV